MYWLQGLPILLSGMPVESLAEAQGEVSRYCSKKRWCCKNARTEVDFVLHNFGDYTAPKQKICNSSVPATNYCSLSQRTVPNSRRQRHTISLHRPRHHFPSVASFVLPVPPLCASPSSSQFHILSVTALYVSYTLCPLPQRALDSSPSYRVNGISFPNSRAFVIYS